VPAALSRIEESAADLEFSYHRSIAPTLGVLLALALIETLVLHVAAMALWGWRVAAVLAVLDVAAIGALVSLLWSIRRMPVVLGADRLTLRLGWLKTIVVPIMSVSALRSDWDAATLKRPGVVNLALANWPNVLVELAPPVRWRRSQVSSIAHKLDDPDHFAAALHDRLGTRL
jgi:hypothetical protein